MRYALLTLALLASPAAAQSGGFTADDLAAAARVAVAETAPDAAATSAAAARSERLRAILAAAMDEAPARLTREELRLITTALGPPTEDRDILLSWLMRGGTVAAAGPDLTGIYNPFADGWLVLFWNTVGGTPRLTDARLVSGPVLSGTTAPLDQADMPFAQALVARRLAALAAFPQTHRESLVRQSWQVQRALADGVLADARSQVGALAQWSRANPQSLAIIARTIRRADDPALLAFPERVREALSPAALVSTPDGTELVLQSPVYPARSLFARFPAAAGEPELFALDLDPATGSTAR